MPLHLALPSVLLDRVYVTVFSRVGAYRAAEAVLFFIPFLGTDMHLSLPTVS